MKGPYTLEKLIKNPKFEILLNNLFKINYTFEYLFGSIFILVLTSPIINARKLGTYSTLGIHKKYLNIINITN